MAYVGRFNGSNSKHASPAMAAAGGYPDTAKDVTSSSTSTKWSVLSSRVEGLVAELSHVVGNMDAYCVSKSNAEGPAMAAVRAKMLETPWGEEWTAGRTMFSYGEEMSTDPLEAMLLKELVALGKPKRVLEIGMFVGYGAVAMLEGCPHAEVVSLEIDPYLKEWLSSCLTDFPQISKRHEIVLGPALDSLPSLQGAFDMVFIDANKAEYKDYVKTVLEKGLLAEDGMIICDNILYNGYPYTNDHFDAQPARRGFGDAIKEFNQWVYDHKELEQIVLPIRDGVSMIRRRSCEEAVTKAASGIPGVSAFYTFPPAPAAMIVDVFLREKGISEEAIKSVENYVDLPAFENRGEECTKMNVQGTVPWFVTSEGTVVAESIAMCEYVDETVSTPSLVGSSAVERGVTRMWQRRLEENFCSPATYSHRNWCHSEDCPSDHDMKNFYTKRLNAENGSGLLYSQPSAWKDLAAWAISRVAWLEKTKQEEAKSSGKDAPSEFICGDKLTMVDIQVYVNMFYWDTFNPGLFFFKALEGKVPWVQAWYDRMHARPAIAAARTYAGYKDRSDLADIEKAS